MKETQDHNAIQRTYFEKGIKETMLPGDTPYINRQVEALLRFGDIAPGSRVLEVGCGMGRYTLAIADRGIAVEGLDLSPFLLEHLKSFAGPERQISTHCCDLASASHDMDGIFDAVIGFFTLHHMGDLKGCLSAVARLLKPRGTAVFLEPNAYNPLYYLQIMASPGMTWQGDKGILKMRPSVVFDAMKQAGLEELSLERFGFFPPYIANRSWGRSAEAMLERFPLWRPFLPFQLFRGHLR